MDLMHLQRWDTVSVDPPLCSLRTIAKSLTIRLGWSGVVGTIVGLLCGGALIVLLPFGVSCLLVLSLTRHRLVFW